jgi:hypothetical protein
VLAGYLVPPVNCNHGLRIVHKYLLTDT